MKLKLDENLGRTVQQVFVDAGHDVETVVSERLSVPVKLLYSIPNLRVLTLGLNDIYQKSELK